MYVFVICDWEIASSEYTRSHSGSVVQKELILYFRVIDLHNVTSAQLERETVICVTPI